MVTALSPLVGSKPASAAPGDISSVAGSLGVGQATAVSMNPIAVLASGTSLYVADGNPNVSVRKIDLTSGSEVAVAGTGAATTTTGDGGPATGAEIQGGPKSLAIDPAGNLYIGQNFRIRKVSPSGIITTFAGVGTNGSTGDGGPATAAKLSVVNGMASDGAGNLYLTDTLNKKVRKVDSSGIITTVAGNGTAGFSGDGGPATAAALNAPLGLTLDPSGNVLIADSNNTRIRKLTVSSGTIDTVAGGGSSGLGDGGPATQAQLSIPNGVAFDSSGNLFISDAFGRIRKVDVTQTISTYAGNGTFGFAGDGGPATAATLSAQVASVTADTSGNVYFGDALRVRRIDTTPSHVIGTFAGNGSASFSGDGGPAGNAQLNAPSSVAKDVSGNLYLADSGNARIRKVDTNGTITTFAGGGASNPGDGGPATAATIGGFGGMAFDSAGDLIVADANLNRVRKIDLAGTITTIAGTGSAGYSGDGGAATAAQLASPNDVALDPAGNIYVADANNNVIRKVDTSGIITTVAGTGVAGAAGDGGPATAAQLNTPRGLTADTSGNLYVGDTFNNKVRRIDLSGTITTFAGNGSAGFAGDGGSARAAKLNGPQGLALDAAGNLLVADRSNNRVREVFGGAITTVAGGGTPVDGFGDGGPALAADINNPADVAVSADGSILVANSGRNRIRKVEGTIPVTPARFVATDFDGDFKSDVSVFRDGGGAWYANESGGGSLAAPYGQSGDIPVPADYDGDHRADLAIFRPSTALWAIGKSSGGNSLLTYGISSDIPVPADYDGDGKADIAIFRPQFGLWYVHRSTDNVDVPITFGIPGDIPVPADYDGDHKADLAVFRPSSDTWFIRPSSGGPDISIAYGGTGDVPVPGDYSGDGKTDVAVYRPSTGLWAYHDSTTAADVLFTYGGIPGDVPVAADYDGDAKTDVAIFRPTYGTWFVHQSSGGDTITTFGISTDTPLPLPYAIRSAFF